MLWISIGSRSVPVTDLVLGRGAALVAASAERSGWWSRALPDARVGRVRGATGPSLEVRHERAACRVRPMLHRSTRPDRSTDALLGLGVEADRIYVDHGLTGTNRERPGSVRHSPPVGPVTP